MLKRRILALLLAAVLLTGLAPALERVATAESNLLYWIGVDVKNQRTTIYSTADNSVIYRWKCTTGSSRKPTPVGVYHLPSPHSRERKEWFAFSRVYVKYATRYTTGLYFHSVLFTKRSDDAMKVSTLKHLGKRGSAGCVRLEVAHAKWICDNCPTGTLVVIHKGVNDKRITSILGEPAGTETTPSLDMPPKLKKMELEPSGTVSLKKGETLQLKCNMLPEGANSYLRWKSSKKSVVKVNKSGLVTGVSKGSATITVTADNGVKTKVKIVCDDPLYATEVSLDAEGTVTLEPGQTLQLNATVEPESAAAGLRWKSKEPDIATVSDSGLVTACKDGTTKITVTTDNKKKATVKVKVVDPALPAKVRFEEKGPITMHVGEKLQLTPLIEPETAVEDHFTWSSSKKKVATVNKSGVVKAKREGTAKITVKTHNKKEATIKIKVVE